MQKIDQLLNTVEAIRDLLEGLVITQDAPTISSFTSKDLLTAKEVQLLFGIVHSTYYRWVARQWLVPIVVGGKHYYRQEDIDTLLQQRKYRKAGGLRPLLP